MFTRRERIARIIDPKAWARADQERQDFPADPHSQIYNDAAYLEDSVIKAGQIMALEEDQDPQRANAFYGKRSRKTIIKEARNA